MAEPLKIARLILGLDDTSLKQVVIMPRLPAGWAGYSAENWPVRTSHGVVRADFSFARTNGLATFRLQVKQGGPLPKLAVRLPAGEKSGWARRSNVTKIELKAP